MWAKVDPETLKKQYDVLGVFKNGPRYWMYDWIELPVGTQHDFDGLQARWFAQVQLPKDFKASKGRRITIRRLSVALPSRATKRVRQYSCSTTPTARRGLCKPTL